MSLTCFFTDTKIAILSDIHKQNHYYFDDTQRIILKLLLTDLIVFDSLNSYAFLSECKRRLINIWISPADIVYLHQQSRRSLKSRLMGGFFRRLT